MSFANRQIIDNDLEPSLQGVKMSRQMKESCWNIILEIDHMVKDIVMWKMNLHFSNFQRHGTWNLPFDAMIGLLCFVSNVESN